MLKIKNIKRYSLARYPKNSYRKWHLLTSSSRRNQLTISIIALLETVCIGACGPPPARPEMVTENEGREIIKRVFSENGIALEEDVPYYLTQGIPDSVALDLDGFNDSLSVGYEYIFEDDHDQFSYSVVKKLDSLIDESGPYIKCVNPVDSIEYPDYESRIEEIIQEFIDYLENQGVI